MRVFVRRERFAAPVIDTVICQDITVGTRQIVNAVPTAGVVGRVAGMLLALLGAGIEGVYLTNRGWPGCTGRPGTDRYPRPM